MDDLTSFSWYFDENASKDTPSRKDDIDYQSEFEHRKDGANFITDLAQHLGILHGTSVTAIVYFHRFYMFHSFNAKPKYLVATSCLLLALKVQEAPQTCEKMVSAVKGLLDDKKLNPFKSDPSDELYDMEFVIVRAIKYRFYITHPFEFLIEYIQKVNINHTDIQQLAQRAWNFLNDSLRTQLCLRYEPKTVACSVIYLATKIFKLDIKDWENRKDGETWWENFVEGITILVIADVCHIILELHGGSIQFQNRINDESSDNEPSTVGANGSSINNEPPSTNETISVPFHNLSITEGQEPSGNSGITNNSLI